MSESTPSPTDIADATVAAPTLVRCIRDAGKGRSVIIVVERGHYSELIELLVGGLSERARVIVLETDSVDSANWRHIARNLIAELQRLAVRNGAFVALGDTSALVQFIYLSDPKLTRTIILVDGSTRPHPGVGTRIAQWVEQRLPLGLPLRTIDKGFDSKSFLHRIRCPVLVATTWRATHRERGQAALLLQGLPTAWGLEIPNPEALADLAEKIVEFQGVPAKFPQRRRDESKREESRTETGVPDQTTP